MLEHKFRLTENYDFQKVKKRGQKIYGPLFSLSWAKNSLDYSRFGFIATAKLGKAAKRHRAVRLLRESVRLMFKKIKPGFDVVFVVKGRMVGESFVGVDREMRRLLKKAELTIRSDRLSCPPKS